MVEGEPVLVRFHSSIRFPAVGLHWPTSPGTSPPPHARCSHLATDCCFMHLTHIRIMHLIWWDKCNILLIFPTCLLFIIYAAITAVYHSQCTWRMFTGRKWWFAQTHAALWRTGPQCLRLILSNKRIINCCKGFLIDAIGCAWGVLLAGCCTH